MFWASGVTPRLAIAAANLDIAVTQSPGHMFVGDLREDDLEGWRPERLRDHLA